MNLHAFFYKFNQSRDTLTSYKYILCKLKRTYYLICTATYCTCMVEKSLRLRHGRLCVCLDSVYLWVSYPIVSSVAQLVFTARSEVAPRRSDGDPRSDRNESTEVFIASQQQNTLDRKINWPTGLCNLNTLPS